MSIAIEIQRLQTAKSDIKAAIEQKGITVGDGTIDTYAAKILEIVGEGGTIDGLNYTLGTAEFAKIDNTITIYHNLGIKPKVVFIWTELTENTPVSTIGLSYHDIFVEPVCLVSEYRTIGSTPVSVLSANSVRELTEEYITFAYRSGSYRFLKDVPYHWLTIDTDESQENKSRYEQGFEDGKNSVAQIDRGLKVAQFISLNALGKSEVVLNLDNVTSLSNFCQVPNAETKNTTVEHLTINIPNKINTMAQMLYCHTSGWDKTLKHLTLNVDTSEVTGYNLCFNNQRTLEIIDGMPLSLLSATNISNMFSYTNSLIEVRFVPNTISKSIEFKQSANLSIETIQSIIDGLVDLTDSTSQTLTVHQDVRNKLTEDQLTTISNKNWAISPAEATN